ncbi:MAG: acyl-CoA thioesterase [Mycobacteriales bacterium]
MSVLLEVLDVERVEEDLYRGQPRTSNLPRTFGGQVAGQALVAATRTVPGRLAVHSLHGYFVRAGDPHAPTVYLVDRLRDGRSFATRQVRAVQEGQVIFTMSASFQSLDAGPDHQDEAPVVPGPEELAGAGGVPDHLVQVHQAEWPEWELVRVPGQEGLPRQQFWLRHRDPLPDDPVLHACALAYASDMTLLACARLPHDEAELQMASLDHAVWFLRPFRADEWLLYDQASPSASLGRGLCHGRIFDLRGRLVATVVQEGLMRTVRPAP